MGIFGSLANALPFLLQTAPAIKKGFEGRDLKQQKNIAGQIGNVANAQLDMNNPLFQNLYQQNKQAGQGNLAETIAELQRQNRMAVSNGRTPLLDQERGGESIFRNLVKGQEDVGNNAVNNTFSQLRNGQTALGGAYNSQNDLTANMYKNDLSKVGSYYSIGDVLKNLFGLHQNNNGETINWQ